MYGSIQKQRALGENIFDVLEEYYKIASYYF